MKKSNLLAIGAVVAVGYVLYKSSSAYGGYGGQGSLPNGGGYGTGGYGQANMQTGGLGRMPGNRRPPQR